jgi:ACS family sodium-dependent inorganic phosphate cotransporter
VQTADFDWDSKTQGLVLSSFFYGYIVTQILGGWLAGRLGGNRVYGIGVAATAVFTLLTPPLANSSVYLLVAVRVIEGLFEVRHTSHICLILDCYILRVLLERSD